MNLITYLAEKVIFGGVKFNNIKSNKAEFAKAETIVFKEKIFEAG